MGSIVRISMRVSVSILYSEHCFGHFRLQTQVEMFSHRAEYAYLSSAKLLDRVHLFRSICKLLCLYRN